LRFTIYDLRFIIDNWQSAIGNRLPALEGRERRLFGMGQGNFRATPLQVANAMAAIARGGVYKPPQLFLVHRQSSAVHHPSSEEGRETRDEGRDLGISKQTLEVIFDGMSAVVNEPGGTANGEFAPVLSSFAEQDVKVYGKTGSTEAPEVAWFAGFAWQPAYPESTAGRPQAQLGDGNAAGEGRAIAIAVVVEGGQHGSSDAAPLARDIIQFCIETGYIGKTLNTISNR